MKDAQGRIVRGRARMKRAARPEVVKVEWREGVQADEGQLQPIASRVLMKVLYAARVCRFDLLRAVGTLAQKVTVWDASCDHRLHRLMSYIAHHTHLRLTGWIGDPAKDLRPHLYCDADLAGCATTQRSTSGVYHGIVGPNSSFPVAVVCKRQTCVSHSTPEAEITAMDHAIRTVGLPAMDVWDIILPGTQLVVREDNDVAIRVIQTGRNPTMRHMNRTHGVSIAAIHEKWQAGQFTVEYVPSSLQAADIFTKSFSLPRQWEAVCRLVGICAAPQIDHMVQSVGIPFGEHPSAESKHGLWFVRPDGSGAWVRRDRRGKRYQTLRGTGPDRSEVTARHTICSSSRKHITPVMKDYASSKEIAAELPGEVPRDITTIFEFTRTKARMVESAVRIAPDTPLIPAIVSEVLP